jgi:hypothetical protein
MRASKVDADRLLFADDTAPPWVLRATADGTPVWPVSDEADRAAILRLAQIFAAEVVWVRGKRGRLESSPEKVVGIGPGTVRAGRLYAHLTGRRFVKVTDADTAFAAEPPAVVIVADGRLDARLLRLASAKADGMPVTGIVCSTDPDALRRQVLVRAAAAQLCGPVDVERVDVRPLRSSGRIDTPGSVALGGASETEEMITGLSCGAAVLTVFGHSDGIDALGGPAIVCARLGQSEAHAATRPPRCQITGECHRLQIPVVEAFRSPKLLAPEAIAARVLAWHTCLGVMPDNWMVHPSWGLGTRLLDSPSVGAFITTWTIGPLYPRQSAAIADLLVNGHRVGDAIALSEWRNPPAATMRLCLLGDPRVRAVPRPALSFDAATSRSATPARGRIAITPTRSEDPLAIAAELLAAGDGGAPLVAALESYARHPDGMSDPALLQRAIVDHIVRGSWSTWLGCWTEAAVIVDRQEHPCLGCGEPADTYVGELGSHIRRRFSSCHACNMLADLPISTDAYLDIPRSRVARLTRWQPAGAWVGRLTLSTTVAQERMSWDWPAKADRTPAEELRTNAWPRGPLRIAFIAASRHGPLVVNRFRWVG